MVKDVEYYRDMPVWGLRDLAIQAMQAMSMMIPCSICVDPDVHVWTDLPDLGVLALFKEMAIPAVKFIWTQTIAPTAHQFFALIINNGRRQQQVLQRDWGIIDPAVVSHGANLS